MSSRLLHTRVREWRKRRGMTQAALASAAGVTRQTIIAIEKGRLNPSISLGLAIAETLQTAVEELFFLGEPVSLAISGTPSDPPSSVPPENEEEPPGAVWDFV